MASNLQNPAYDEHFLIEQIASESPLFAKLVEDALTDVDENFPENNIWLGTLQSGKKKTTTQINLTVTQVVEHFIDEVG